MNKALLFILVVFAVLHQHGVVAQTNTPRKSILDDSTKMKYGPESVIFQTDQDVYYNRTTVKHPSLSLNGIQDYQNIFHNHVYRQDLGNFLTPRGRIIQTAPEHIGVRYGYYGFSDYALVPDSLKYYDTRSPYTKIEYTQGSKGQQRIYATHSRNITNRWNMTAYVRRMAAKKYLGRLSRIDRQGDAWSFALTSRYYSKNAKYQMLTQVSSFSITHQDNGGIVPDSTKDFSNTDLYDYDLETVRLYRSVVKDKRVYARVYHQYTVTKDSTLQLFNQLDFQSRYNTYEDTSFQTNLNFYPNSPDTTSAYAKSEMYEGNWKLGVKGSRRTFFYALYYRGQYYHFKQARATWNDQERINSIFGGEFITKVIRSLYAGVKAEVLPELQQHVADLTLYHTYFEVRAKQTAFSSTMQQQQFYSTHTTWDNNFNNIELKQVEGILKYQIGSFYIRPSINYSIWNNYVFQNEQNISQQYQKAFEVLSGTIDVSFHKRRWIAHSITQFNHASNEDVVRVPTWVSQNRILLQGFLFKKATFMQIGVDVFYRSSWLGNSYNPLTQTFYNSSRNHVFNQLQDYAVADVFLNMQIKTARFFVKMSYINQGMFGMNGYMVTPYYSGMARVFEFGINWQFFD